MRTIHIESLIEKIYATVQRHKLDGEGRYARWIWQKEGYDRELGINEYGCADAANILYTIGRFPSESAEREAWIRALQGLQDPESGLWREATHHYIHTTAHCTAALELFDAKPAHRVHALLPYAKPEKLYELLESLDWLKNPWGQSHQGAGIYAILQLTGEADDAWRDAYFGWLWDNADPETGLWRKGCTTAGEAPAYQHMAGSFHYLFNVEHAHQPLRYPDKMIDSCLDMYEKKAIGGAFGAYIGFLEIDWVFCLTRASRQTPHRFFDVREALEGFTVDFIDYLNSLDTETHDVFNDLHALFGTVCCLAELQQALPGMLRTKVPLKLVLDRRPFI